MYFNSITTAHVRECSVLCFENIVNRELAGDMQTRVGTSKGPVISRLKVE
jgi:hypothetical protein